MKWSSPSANEAQGETWPDEQRGRSTAMLQESAHSEARHCTPLGTRPTRLKLSTAVLRQRRVVLRVKSNHGRRLRGVVEMSVLCGAAGLHPVVVERTCVADATADLGSFRR